MSTVKVTREQMNRIAAGESPDAVLGRSAPPSTSASPPASLSAPPPPEDSGAVPDVESKARGALQGMSFGWGDEGSAAIAAALPFLDPEAVGEGKTFSERYDNARAFYRAKNAAASSAHPGSYKAGELLGGAVPAVTAPALRGLAGTTLLGATAGGGYSNADSAAGVVGDSLGGGAVGAGFYGAAKGVGAALSPVARWLANKVGSAASSEVLTATPVAQKPGIVRRLAEASVSPTPEARTLQAAGVPLTVGQLNPRSTIGQLEEASTSLRGVGPAIRAQRDAALEAWQRVALRKGLPPGMSTLPPGHVDEQLDAIYRGFGPAYDAVKGEAIYPAIHMNGSGMPLQTLGKSVGAFDRAVQDPSVLADDATRNTVGRFLQNQLSILPERQGAIGKVPVDSLLAMRSNIREAWRNAVRQQKYDAAALLDNAEKATTQAIESQVAPETSAALRDADAQYRVYKILEDTVSRSGDSPSGFTPSQLTAAIKASMDRGAFARGGGGELRDLSKAGRAVFESVIPPTGARVLATGALGEYGTGPMTFLLNRPPAPPPTAIEDWVRRLTTGGAVGASGAYLDDEGRR